ncbi:MAG: DUF4158 domain-containing protein, partial [Gammaproteobacteria bacterium]|nr:DUF4158 domain-containing protein [Gammaproteobacteria bacterium]
MYASNKLLTLLPSAEQAALYDVPEFDDDQRLEYFSFTSKELVIVNSRPGLVDKVHCAVQIGYFKAKHLFFKLVWEEAQEDVDFILQQHFQGNSIKTIHVTDHEYYSQCDEIMSLFKYQRWSKGQSELLKDQVK